ncbi:MAG: TIGR00159 family protein [Candidatus Omnitrophica bacterium]|nr:TIGR00159 family protein [Candidatus Omnitrophota bacterium]
MTDFLHGLFGFLRGALEIGILWAFIYWLLVYFQGSVAVLVFRGAVVLALVFLLAGLLRLEVLVWLFAKIAPLMAVGFLVIFHPELRRGLARIGGETLFRTAPRREEVVEEILRGVLALSRRRIGAILAIEGQTSLQVYAESGVGMDATISSELLQTIFMPGTPLHDGGVVISRGRLVAAAALFPLSENPRLSKTMGTRHRAAVGLSEEADATVIVVSEETGTVSLARKGELTKDLNREEIAKLLYGVTGTRPPEEMVHSTGEEKG